MCNSLDEQFNNSLKEVNNIVHEQIDYVKSNIQETYLQSVDKLLKLDRSTIAQCQTEVRNTLIKDTEVGDANHRQTLQGLLSGTEVEVLKQKEIALKNVMEIKKRFIEKSIYIALTIIILHDDYDECTSDDSKQMVIARMDEEIQNVCKDAQEMISQHDVEVGREIEKYGKICEETVQSLRSSTLELF